MFKSRKLSSNYKNIIHYFFNSEGGVSSGLYNSLNCGLGSNDKKNNIIKNLKIVKNKINCKNNNLILLNQIHSNKVHSISKVPRNKITGDGFITREKGLALGILTADCAPILFYDSKIKIIGAAHVGWKGAFKNITKKVLNNMQKWGSNNNNIIVVIGPCISCRNYEVKKDFMIKFLKKYNCKSCFIKKTKMIYFDLAKFIKQQLIKNGVKNIDIIKKDTFRRANKFFSSRYNLKNKFDDYGRNITVIMIK